MIPLILISIITSILIFKKETILSNMREPFIWLIVTSCIYTLFSYYYHGSSSRELRALIGVSLFLLFFPYKLLTKKITIGTVFIGGIFVLINSTYLNIYMGIARNSGYINPIPYATACSLLAIIAFSLSIGSFERKEIRVSFISFLLYLPPIVLSESRGVWLAFSVTLIILIIVKCLKRTPTKKQVIVTILTALVLSSTALFCFKGNIKHRYDKTIYEIKKIQDNNYYTSIGFRFQMWMLVPELFEKSPLLGHGQEHRELLKKMLKNKDIGLHLFNLASSHYHNQFLDKIVRGGIIGLILLVITLTYPLTRLRNLQEHEVYIVVGITSLFFIAGLTDVPFNHPQPLMLYLLFLVPICSRGKRVTND